MRKQEIPLENLEILENSDNPRYSRIILENEIEGINVEHVTIKNGNELVDCIDEGFKAIYLFVSGAGSVVAEDISYEIVPETIFLPNAVKQIKIKSNNDAASHYLKVSCQLSAQDQLDLQALPAENTKNVYYAKFSDCQSYSEEIKSPNTVSRTILSNKYIPRVAMGTVQTKGPDKVAAHKHPMLEQLFLGLSHNNCIVYADDYKVNFPQYSVLHIPLGSTHSVSVEKDEVMYYVWMDFFLDRKGEEWLNTHKEDANS